MLPSTSNPHVSTPYVLAVQSSSGTLASLANKVIRKARITTTDVAGAWLSIALNVRKSKRSAGVPLTVMFC